MRSLQKIIETLPNAAFRRILETCLKCHVTGI
jgi:hypothetical protein